MFGIGHIPELIALLVVLLIIVGPGKIPSLGSAIGRTIRDFKRETGEVVGPVREDPRLPDRDRTHQV
jgi:sec-independent protein translocase protein TatA